MFSFQVRDNIMYTESDLHSKKTHLFALSSYRSDEVVRSFSE